MLVNSISEAKNYDKLSKAQLRKKVGEFAKEGRNYFPLMNIYAKKCEPASSNATEKDMNFLFDKHLDHYCTIARSNPDLVAEEHLTYLAENRPWSFYMVAEIAKEKVTKNHIEKLVEEKTRNLYKVYDLRPDLFTEEQKKIAEEQGKGTSSVSGDAEIKGIIKTNVVSESNGIDEPKVTETNDEEKKK